MRVAVKVAPRSSRDEVVGWRGGELQVRVGAPPENGRANAAVCATLAHALGVSKSSVRVVRGGSAHHKIVEVDGVDENELERVLGGPDASLF